MMVEIGQIDVVKVTLNPFVSGETTIFSGETTIIDGETTIFAGESTFF